jgi:hypothetical protein
MLVVGGKRLEREDVLTLAGLLTRDGSERTARVLLEALVHGRVFAALTTADKECILAVLGDPPAPLAPLREALFDELNWQRAGLVPPSRSRGMAAAIARGKRERVNVAWV